MDHHLHNRNNVGKRVNWKRELASPRTVARIVGQHPQLQGFGAGTAVGGGLAVAPKGKRRNTQNETAGALLGAGAGQGAYQLAGYAPSHYARHRLRWNAKPSDFTDPAAKTAWKQQMKQRKEHKVANTKNGATDWAKYYRTFPEDHPYSRVFRAIGHTHAGTSGRKIGAAVTGVGAVGGLGHAIHNRNNVGKSLYARDRQTSVTRGAETALGAGLLAYGVPRLRMTSQLIARGAKAAKTNHRAQEALVAAEAARIVLEQATARGAIQARRIRAVDRAVTQVPESLRPAVATLAGAMLGAHAHPVRRDTYRPVSGSSVYGW